MALFTEKGQDAEVYHLSQQLAQAVEIILSPDSSREKRVAATRVGTSLFIWLFTVVYNSSVCSHACYNNSVCHGYSDAAWNGDGTVFICMYLHQTHVVQWYFMVT